MDHELPPEDRQRIYEIAANRAGVSDVHDLRTRSSGTQVFIQLHLEMDGNLRLRDAHTISDQVEFDVQHAYPNAEVLIHADPEELDEEHARPKSATGKWPAEKRGAVRYIDAGQ